LIGRNSVNLIVGWSGRFLFFVVPRQFSQDIGKWQEDQILIPDWTYFHCPGATQPLWRYVMYFWERQLPKFLYPGRLSKLPLDFQEKRLDSFLTNKVGAYLSCNTHSLIEIDSCAQQL